MAVFGHIVEIDHGVVGDFYCAEQLMTQVRPQGVENFVHIMAAYVFLECRRTGVCAGESCCRSIVEKPEDSVSVARVGCEYVVQASGCGLVPDNRR